MRILILLIIVCTACTSVFSFPLNGQKNVTYFPEAGLVIGTLYSTNSVQSRFILGSTSECLQTGSGIQEITCELPEAGYQLELTGNSTVEWIFEFEPKVDAGDDDDDNVNRDLLISTLVFTVASFLCLTCLCISACFVVGCVCIFGTTAESTNVAKDGGKITKSIGHWVNNKKKSFTAKKSKSDNADDNADDDVEADDGVSVIALEVPSEIPEDIDLEGFDLEDDDSEDGGDDEKDDGEDHDGDIDLDGILEKTIDVTLDTATPIVVDLVEDGVSTGLNAGVNNGKRVL